MPSTVLPWRHASELAFVRDCFYPHHSNFPTSTAATGIDSDIYAPPSDLTYSTTNSHSQSQTHSHPDHPTRQKTNPLLTSYQAGLSRISIWQFKSSSSSIPHAVSATALLVEAKYYDLLSSSSSFSSSAPSSLSSYATATTITSLKSSKHEQEPAQSELSTSALISLYSIAILRFVNGFVDRDIVRSSKKRRMVMGLSSSTNNANAQSRLKSFKADMLNSDPTSDNDSGFNTDSGTSDIDTPRSHSQSSKIALSVSTTTLAAAPPAACNNSNNNNMNNTGDSSMYTHANQINLPTSFVDLRHKCVHGKIGSVDLVVLRKQTDKALEWLWERWWRVQAVVDAGRYLWEVEEGKKRWEEEKGKAMKRTFGEMEEMTEEEEDETGAGRDGEGERVYA